MLAHYLLEPDQRHNMDVLAQNYLNYSPISIETLIGKKGKNQLSMRQTPLEQLYPYACEDADITFRLYKKFFKRLKEEKMINIYEVFEKPMIKILADMEIEGIKIDDQFLKILSSKFGKKIEKIQNEIFKISKKDFNIASPKQLGEILYNDLKIADLKKTKKGSFATSASVLEDLSLIHI